jgi:hypothetical protein
MAQQNAARRSTRPGKRSADKAEQPVFTRVHGWCKEAIERRCRNTGASESQVIRDILYQHFAKEKP